MNLKAIRAAVGSFGLIRCCQDRKAAISLTVGLLAPLLVGAVAFAVDAGLWISQHTALQTATDAAAMKGARDLSANPTITSATLTSDALAAAAAAAPNTLKTVIDSTTGNTALGPNSNQTFNVTQPTATEVKVTASISGDVFFSRVIDLLPGASSAFSVAIGASSTAGLPATCYSMDSYSYLFSTGLGAIDTAHSSGIDLYSCGGSPPSPPISYVAYGGVLGTSLGSLAAGLVDQLLPFAITIEPNSPPPPPSASTLPIFDTVVAPVVQTVTNLTGLLVGDGATASNHSIACSNNICTVPAGVYSGGLTLPGTVSAPVTVNFVADSYGNNTFQIQNGDLIIPTSDTVNANNAIFYFDGTTPGGLVETTQQQITTPINTGAIVLTSSAIFSSNSLVGTQTSAPISAYPYINTYESNQGLLPSVSLNGRNGALSFLGMPAGNLVGTNFVSALATCPQATSTCNTPSIQTPPTTQQTLIPSLSGTVASTVSSLETFLNVRSIPIIALLTSNEGEVSTTTITSAATFINGQPNNWWQQESENSALTNTTQTVTPLLNYLGLPNNFITDTIASALNTITSLLEALGLQSPGTTSPSYANSGNYPGQSSSASSTPSTSASANSCSGQTMLYNKQITPSFSPNFSDVLDSGGANNPNGTNGKLTMTNTFTVCGRPWTSVYLLQ